MGLTGVTALAVAVARPAAGVGAANASEPVDTPNPNATIARPPRVNFVTCNLIDFNFFTFDFVVISLTAKSAPRRCL
jgi:hypothetical protein